MPYASNDMLPPGVRHRLPDDAQDIYREAFNHAWQTYGTRADREAVSHRVAWAAVKRSYMKSGETWIPR